MKATVAELARLPGVWRGGELDQALHPVVPTGQGRLDRELPGGGWPVGTLSEVLHDGVGIGEVSFLAGALAAATREDRLVAWIAPPHLPYAPALAQAGLDLARCLVVRPARREDALWSLEQALKSGACGAVLGWLDDKVDYAALRRLQMAAEAGRAMAILFRPAAAERLSTPAHLRVVVSLEAGVTHLRIPKRRGPPLVQPLPLVLRGRRAPKPIPQEHAATRSPSPVLVPFRPRARHREG